MHYCGVYDCYHPCFLLCAGSSQHHLSDSNQTSPSTSASEVQDDWDAETELASVVKDDPLAAYDVDVRQEGMAIQEYLRLLQGLDQNQ